MMYLRNGILKILGIKPLFDFIYQIKEFINLKAFNSCLNLNRTHDSVKIKSEKKYTKLTF